MDSERNSGNTFQWTAPDGLYRELFEQSPIAILVVDPETLLCVDFNNAASKTLGYTREEFARTPIHLLESGGTIKDARSEVSRILETGFSDMETVCRRKNGELIDAKLRARVIGISGRPYIFLTAYDISSQKQIEINLSKSESRYRSLVENSPDIIMEITPEGMILYANRILKGLNQEDALGTSLLDYLPRAYHRRVRKALQRSFTRKRNTAYELSALTPDGERWWQTRVLPLEKDGKINRFLLIVTDTTETKRVEEALRISEERYRGLVENTPSPIIVHQLGELIYVNPAIVRLMGVKSPDELLGKSILDFVHADDRAKVNNRITEAILSMNTVSSLEFRLQRSDGGIIDVDTAAITLNFEGKPSRLVILNDVTERKRAEEALRESEKKYRYLTENMRDAVFLMDMNWRHQYISPSIELIRGFTAEEIYNLPIEESLPSHSLENAKKLLAEHLAVMGKDEDGNPMSVTFEQEEYCKDGSTVWTEVRAFLVMDEENNPVGIMGCTRDISERKKIEKALTMERIYLEQIIDLNPIAIGIFDSDGRMESHNQAFIDIFKSPLPDDYVVFNDPIARQAGYAELLQKAQAGETVKIPAILYDPQLVNPDHPSVPFWVKATIFSIRDSLGEIEKYIFMGEDVSEHYAAG